MVVTIEYLYYGYLNGGEYEWIEPEIVTISGSIHSYLWTAMLKKVCRNIQHTF